MSRVKKSRASKFLALVVALTFLLSMAAPAFASAPAALQQTEAARLQTLGIIAGFPDGSLGLDQTITRAQFAKVIAIATGNEIIADAMINSPTSFPDAKVGVWYTGYVNVASELGYILGYPDGTFKPNQAITNAEVLTILLRALGYDDRLPGSWPTDYLVKANELGISDDVTFAAKAAALRGDAFIFTSRTLDTNMVKWDSDANEFVERFPAITLLAKAFKGTTDEGVLADLTWDGGKLMATIATVSKESNNATVVATNEYEILSKVVVSGSANLLDLLAKKVSYVLNSDDQIIYLGAKDTDTVTDNAINKVEDKKAEINDKNYNLVDSFDSILFAFPTSVPNVYEADRVTAVLDSGKIMAVLFEEYTNPGIVKSVEDNYITLADGSLASDVDLSDKDFAVIKDGNIASLNDIEAGDLVYILDNVEGLDYLVIAVGQDKAIEGTLESANSDFSKITVAGTQYDVDKDAIGSSDGGENYDMFSNLTRSDFMGKDVALLLSPAGKVAAITADFEAKTGLYGVLIAADTYLSGGQVKILTTSGDKTVFDVDEDEITVVTNTVYDKDDNIPIAIDNLVKYTLNSKGEIDSIAKAGSATLNDMDKDNNRIKINGSYYRVTDATVFFAKDGATQDWKTYSWSTFAKSGISNGNVSYAVDNGNVTAVAYNGVILTTGDYGVILESGYNSDGGYYKLMVLGNTVTYNLVSGDPTSSVVGKVYNFSLNADNEIDLGTVHSATYANAKVTGFSTGNYIKFEYQGTEYTYLLDKETSIVDIIDHLADPTKSPVIRNSVTKGKLVDIYIDTDDFVDYIVIRGNAS